MHYFVSGSILIIYFEIILGSPGSRHDNLCGVIPRVKVRHRSRDSGLSSFGQIPWQVAIISKPEGLVTCSGTLLSPDWVLTSPVCLLGRKTLSDLEIRIGDWDIADEDNAGETFEHFSTSVVKAVFHPDIHMSQGRTRPKFVLLKLKNAVQFESYPQIGPICIPPNAVKLTDSSLIGQCFVSGWGSPFSNTINSSETGEEDDDDQIKVQTIQEEEDTQDGDFDAYDNASPLDDEYNSLESFKHLKLTISDPPIPDKFPSDPLIPDPVEDYIDEVQAEKFANSDSDTVPSHAPTTASDDSEELVSTFYSPMLDSLYPIEEHHEDSLYKHKLKYKQGKLRGHRKITKVKKDLELELEEENEQFQHSTQKRFTRWHYSGRGPRNRKVLYSNHAQPEKATILKLFKVEVRDNCPVMENWMRCASPSNGHYDMFPCMADLGSPVFCYDSEDTGHSPGSANVASPKSFLIGFVPAVSTSCYENLHKSQRPNFLQISLLSSTDLMFLNQTLLRPE